MKQLFFAIEFNLEPLQMPLRGLRCSAFLITEPEIDLPQKTKDSVIVKHIAKQNHDLGIDRIIITRDKRFQTYLGSYNVKLIILNDKTKIWNLYKMRLNEIAEEIFVKATQMIKITPGQYVEYVECSKHYKK